MADNQNKKVFSLEIAQLIDLYGKTHPEIIKHYISATASTCHEYF